MRSLGLCALLLFVACDDNTTSNDMAMGKTCTEICQRYLTCFEMVHPEFMGSANAMVPCENICFSDTEQQRTDLRACFPNDCASYVTCGMAAGLKLMPKMGMDASIDSSVPMDQSTD